MEPIGFGSISEGANSMTGITSSHDNEIEVIIVHPDNLDRVLPLPHMDETPVLVSKWQEPNAIQIIRTWEGLQNYLPKGDI
jgi:hypothetical protein